MIIHPPLRASRLRRCASALAGFLALALCDCSFDLGSWSSSSPAEKQALPKAAPDEGSIAEAQAATGRAQALLRSGKTEDALAEFDRAVALDPHNAQALYNRGLLYQGEKQHQLAIEDFTSANGLTPQRSEPLLGRAVSYLAVEKFKEATVDLDEAAELDPQNARTWTTRGVAYERLGERAKAAESYRRAIELRPNDEAARVGFARVAGKPG